jgi:hypothetical protein
MPKHDQIQDEAIRALLATAHQQMRTGKASDAVRSVADAYLAMLSKRPEMMDETIELRPGRTILAVMRWPAFGANLDPQSVVAKAPRIEFTRERFATSEAITYYEYAVEQALAKGL